MNIRAFAGAVMAAGLLGCGGPVTVYKGTVTQTSTTNGATSTSTTTGQTIAMYTGGEGGSVFVELGGQMINFTRAGDALTAVPGQGTATTYSNGQSSQTITSATGTVNGMGLSLNISGNDTQTSGGQTQTSTFTLVFTGTKQ